MSGALSREELIEAATAAAADLREVAADITRAIDELAANTSRGSRHVLEVQARRALAIAVALQVEASGDPDSRLVGLQLQARRRLGAVLVAALPLVGVGAAEQLGSESVKRLTNWAAQVAFVDPEEEGSEREGASAFWPDMAGEHDEDDRLVPEHLRGARSADATGPSAVQLLDPGPHPRATMSALVEVSGLAVSEADALVSAAGRWASLGAHTSVLRRGDGARTAA